MSDRLWVAGAVARALVRGLTRGRRSGPPARAERSVADIRQLPSWGWTVPTRAQQLARLHRETFDVLVVGGGATGAGTALEAAARGLTVALVERGDFASGTSSRSTKLIHGGVRYLEKAVMRLDRIEYELVFEGLEERRLFMAMAPHLTSELRLLTPCYRWWEMPYYAAGLFLYDWIAGQDTMQPTRVLGRATARSQVPVLRQEGLWGGVSYSDGQFDDARMNVGLAVTAAVRGAAVANYVEVEGLSEQRARLRDRLSGDEWEVQARCIVNAAGPFIDAIRRMADPDAVPLVVPSAGTHIFVPRLQLSEAVLIPRAPNGSVAFLKPFEGGTLIGTTEEKTDLTFEPRTTGEHVEYLRQLANQYLDVEHQIGPADITSVWTGIRPLVRDPARTSTVSLSRTHLIEVSPSRLITIGGGKWTSFRRMAQDVVDKAIEVHGLSARPPELQSVVGAEGWSPSLGSRLAQAYQMPMDVAEHLAQSYGDRAIVVADLGLDTRLSKDHPYIEGEVIYAVRHEYAVDPTDVLSRRLRLSFIDEAATRQAVPRVVQLMGRELGWTGPTAAADLDRADAHYAGQGMQGLKV